MESGSHTREPFSPAKKPLSAGEGQVSFTCAMATEEYSLEPLFEEVRLV
jgi:hypothetical protein